MIPQDELTMLKGFIQLSKDEAVKRDNLETFLNGRSKTLLIDSDSLLYNVVYHHKDKENDFDIMFEDFYSQVRAIGNYIEGSNFIVEDIIYFFTTCKNNFRKDIYPEYKANRKEQDKELREMVYKFKDYVIIELESEFQEVVYSDVCEADDLVRGRHDNNSIICSIDKDLRQIEGAHFDYYKVKTGDVDEFGYDVKDYRGWSYTTKQEGYDLFLKQMLIGDVSDNIKGVKGVGKVGANKIVTGSNFEKLLKVARSYKDMERMRLNVKLMRL